MHPSKTLPQVFIIIAQAEGGEDYVVEKITKINKGIGHKFL